MCEEEWTPMVGLRRAFSRMVIRSAIALVVWTVVLWFITPVLNVLEGHWMFFGIVTVAMVPPGVTIGHGLARKMEEITGMTGLPVAAMAIVFGWAIAVLAVVIAHSVRPIGDWQHGYVTVATGMSATLWVIKATMLDS